MTVESKLLFRRGTKDLFRLCQSLDIKAMIVSGGIYELIEESLRLLERQPSSGDAMQEQHDFSWVNILSNQFEYEDQVVKGYKTPLIHSANKLEVIYNAKRGKELLRKNVIVMGDIVEDGKMACVDTHKTILRIGFLNTEEHYSRQIDVFKQTFDLIVYRDGSLCPIIYSLKSLFSAAATTQEDGGQSLPKIDSIDGH